MAVAAPPSAVSAFVAPLMPPRQVPGRSTEVTTPAQPLACPSMSSSDAASGGIILPAKLAHAAPRSHVVVPLAVTAAEPPAAEDVADEDATLFNGVSPFSAAPTPSAGGYRRIPAWASRHGRGRLAAIVGVSTPSSASAAATILAAAADSPPRPSTAASAVVAVHPSATGWGAPPPVHVPPVIVPSPVAAPEDRWFFTKTSRRMAVAAAPAAVTPVVEAAAPAAVVKTLAVETELSVVQAAAGAVETASPAVHETTSLEEPPTPAVNLASPVGVVSTPVEQWCRAVEVRSSPIGTMTVPVTARGAVDALPPPTATPSLPPPGLTSATAFVAPRTPVPAAPADIQPSAAFLAGDTSAGAHS
eukprot:TRINITY_DN28_c1_g1_i4.p2 TRINITY_DN28_c1_g1~~TRINITY_DN28_c1_g1_i4.p2  ORF type:complete len:367 (-),score=59.00 TRINITY_DN28_c1_g1_i4:2760-3839(-)